MKNKKLTIIVLLLALTLVLPFITVSKEVNADDNLVVMKKGSGDTLYYRNSNEKVYMLKEYDYPTAEYRAVWVSTFVGDIPEYTTEDKFKADATELLDNLVRMGMNAMVFHVRTHNNALYDSDLNPIASWWRLVDFDTFDPLTWLIDETHKRGIEFHAWMNPYRISDGFTGEAYPAGHPCLDSTQVLSSSSGKILDPGSERVQDFIVDTCMEFLDRYDADAIHFDDYFYISGVANHLSANEKRANVDAFIKKLSDKMYEMNIKEGRAVQLGISPSGIYRNGSYSSGPSYDENGNLKSPVASNTSGFAHYGDYLYSDTKKWIDEEWIDYITPQTYWGIEHTVASFVELSRWWSWAVRYKKVNLYLGMGIYMADSTGSSGDYWRKNPDEVKNQILNSAQYDEVKGICYYKYTYLFSDTSYIKNGVDLITNDYYAKRIPGAVIQRYATTLPSVKASNLNIQAGTFSWNKIDNVYGYMVYQVPKGQALDTNNIDHVLVYTQDTEVKNVDPLKYDYYVSSVNRANVKSTPVQYGAVELKAYEQVIEYINALPSQITLNNEQQVVSIREQYSNLSDEDKTKVNNIQILLNAENTIASLKVLKEKAQTFVEKLDKRINTSRVLPVEDNMKWSYVNSYDSNKYNITTGKRLINFIGSMPIKLYLEVTDGTYTHKEIVEFDLCMLQETQVGLYYRNDPSAMSEHHSGSHTGATSFIGWADATLTLGNYVLFLAVGNYHELTSSTIPSCNWTSCGGTYINKSTSNITMKLSQAFSTESSTYGYLVIGSNKTVKKVSTTSPGSESVTLLPGETLFIVRYLDRLINSTPFTAVDSITVGTSAYITKYSDIEISPKDEGEAVVALINTLPANITLNDEALINNIQSVYDALSVEAKKYVTNLSTLTNAKNKIWELKEELFDYKNAALKEIQSYADLNNYSVENQLIIKENISETATKINNASNFDVVDSVVELFKATIDKLVTIEQEIVIYKEQTLKAYLASLDISKYSEANQTLINGYIATLKASIEAAKTKMEVDQAIDNIKSSVANLKTIEEELAGYRTELKNEIANYASDKSYSSQNQDKVDMIIYNASTAINNAKSLKEMQEIVKNAKAEIDLIPTKEQELQSVRAEAIDKYVEYITSLEIDTNEIIGLEQLITLLKDNINKQNSVQKINAALESAKNETYLHVINHYATLYVKHVESTFPLTNYEHEYKSQVQALINSIKENITTSTTKEQLDAKVVFVMDQIKEIPTIQSKLESSKAEVREYLNSLLTDDLTDEQYAKVEELVETKLAELEEASTEYEIDVVKSSAELEYDEIITEEDDSSSSTNCQFASIKQIITLTVMLGLLVVVLRKRK